MLQPFLLFCWVAAGHVLFLRDLILPGFQVDAHIFSIAAGERSFSMLCAFSGNFVLPFWHGEVMSGKGSMIRKMPGDDWQKFANLRLLYRYMFGHPGKKLLFRGDEIGQWSEWNHDASLDWHLLLNSDAPVYGGTGQGNAGGADASPLPIHGRPYSLSLTLPPLGIVVLQPQVQDVS